jgi:excisionase family DNA binding protein
METKLTLTAKEAAALLGVSLPTLYSLARSDGFPSFRINKKVMISRVHLERWIADQAGA